MVHVCIYSNAHSAYSIHIQDTITYTFSILYMHIQYTIHTHSGYYNIHIQYTIHTHSGYYTYLGEWYTFQSRYENVMVNIMYIDETK